MNREIPGGEAEIFDAHVHFFSHRFFKMLAAQSPRLKDREDAVDEIGRITGLEMPSDDPAELAGQWLNQLDQNRISRALLIASLPNDEESVAAAVKLHPDRFHGAFFFNPKEPEPEARLIRALDDLKLQVVSLFPAMHGFSVADDPNVRKIAEIVSKRKGTAIFVHCGALSVGIRGKLGLKSPFDLRLSNPLEVHRLASEFPEVNFIIPHFGAGLWRETLMAADLCQNIFLDTSSTNKWTKYEASATDMRTVFERTIEVTGTSRLLFGSDSSFFPRGWNSEILNGQTKVLQDLKIAAEEIEAILGGNLARLLT